MALPDGRTQIVTYHADHANGFIADVKYEGVPHHPPVKGYAPAPVPHPVKHHPRPHHPAPHHVIPAPHHLGPHGPF